MTLIKLLMILAVVGLLILLLRSHGTNKGGALVKLGMVAFLIFAIYAVIRPDDVSWVAARLGVGRGADLVLYLLVMGFGFFAISTYLRFKELELKFARLARAVALLEVDDRERQSEVEGSPGPGVPSATTPSQSISELPSPRSAASDDPPLKTRSS